MKGQLTIYLLAAALAALCFSAPAHAFPKCTLSAPEIDKRIHQGTTREINAWLYANNSAEMGKLSDCVVTGEKVWLDIAKAVLTISPEDGDDELSMALASALDSNPENVLAEPWPFPLDLICHVSFDDSGNYYPTYELAIKSLDIQIKKVEGVKRPDLQSKVQKCVDSLNENKKWMAHDYGLDNSVQ